MTQKAASLSRASIKQKMHSCQYRGGSSVLGAVMSGGGLCPDTAWGICLKRHNYIRATTHGRPPQRDVCCDNN